MRQVFFITDDRMTAMLWQGSQLISKYEFDDSEIPQLAQYLENSKDIVTSIIVDVLEEEISLTTIPHVGPRERKFLIDRTLTRLHRGAEFSMAKVVGRENNKRRDDRLLISGMTSSHVLTKWLNVLNQHNLFIKGIYSLPLIAGNVLNVLKVNKGLTLLVSRQSNGFIRQSVFKDGKLFYSRNIPSLQNLEVATFSVDLQKTRKYLENQKLINTDDSVEVLILTSQRFLEQLKGLDELLPDMNISYVQHESLKTTLGIRSEYKVSAREIFSSLLLGSLTTNHYGRDLDLERYNKQLKEHWVNYSSVVVAVILIVITSVFYIDIEVLEHRVDGIEEQLNVLKEHNDRLEIRLDKLPAKAQKMKVFVKNMSDIKQVNDESIKKSLITISRVFHAYQNIHLTQLNWNVSEADYRLKPKKNSHNKRSSRNKRVKKVIPKNLGSVVDIEAIIDLTALNNQSGLRVVENFIKSLEALKAVRLVNVNKKAIKATSKDSMRGVLSAKQNKKTEISLTLYMEST